MPRSQLSILVLVVLAVLVATAAAGPQRGRRRPTGKATHVAASEASPERLDERTTTVHVTVRKRPGERQAAVGKLPVGTAVVVEAEQGRWLRVRAGRLTGYVTRTTLSDPSEGPMADAQLAPRVAPTDDDAAVAVVPTRELHPTSWRTARDRETSLAAASSLLATVAVPSTVLRARPEVAAAEVARIEQGAQVIVVDAHAIAGWVSVRNEKGHTGWIAKGDLGNRPNMMESAVRPAVGEAPRPRPVAITAPGSVATDEPRRAWSVRLRAGAGHRALATDVEASGAARSVAGRASVARLELDATASPLRVISLGIDAHVELGRSTSQVDDSVTAVHATRGLNAGVRVGIRPRGLAELSLRAGMRRETAAPMTGAGVTEQLAGATAGVRLDVSPPRSRLTARVGVDTLVAGTWQQGDATTPSAPRAMWAGMTVGIRVVGGVSVHAAFELAHASTAWSQMTTTEPASARRVDASQLFQVGLSGAL